MGTPAFMPPEQASAHWNEVDEQSDIWALGASMFVLLTGTYVYRGGTVNESLVQAITGTAPKIQNVEPSVPTLVAEIVDRALEREKSYRYASAVEMQAAVRQAYRELQESPEDSRYSLADGRVAAHSSPPGVIYSSGSYDGPFDLHTPDPMAAAAAALRPQRRNVLWIGAGALALGVILLFWLGSGEDEPTGSSAVSPSPSSDARAANNAGASTASPAPEVTTPAPETSADEPAEDEGEAINGDEPAEAQEAEEDDSLSGAATRARSTPRVKRPARVRPPTAKSAPKPAPEPEEFDPFAKRH
jgi:serine/threonine-protein kinase